MTEREYRVLEFIGTYIRLKGFAPSMQDIATGLDLRSRSNIHRIVHNLRRQGLIKMNPNKVRTMKVVDKSVKEIAGL